MPQFRRVLSNLEPQVVSASDLQSQLLSDFPLLRQAFSQTEIQVDSTSDKLSQLIPLVALEALKPGSLQSAMVLPLMIRGAAIGFIFVGTDYASRSYTADDVSLAETIAGDIAVAVENTRLLEQAQASAVKEERSRLARELHDSVTQTLYSVSIVAEALPRVLDRDPEEAKRSVGHLRRTTLGALAEMRTLLFELRPDSLEEADIGTLLGQLGDALSGRTRIPVEVTVEGESKLPLDVKLALYRIAQEAFNNIARHSKAAHVTATLQRLPDRAILIVRDDGLGFEIDSILPERLGVRIMQERAKSIGAAFTIESQGGQGTQITVEWKKDEGRITEDHRPQTTSVQ
jgi:signal transduction histidine kinase